MEKHAVHKLFDQRMAKVTKPFNARGADVVRCPRCRISQDFCTCSYLPAPLPTKAGFLLLFYDDEVLKPSNTGKLIADLCKETYAFLWKRTEVDERILQILNEPKWFPVVVFPSLYADANRPQIKGAEAIPEGKRPLFVMLDGSWREAKKMFRKSPYLDAFPLFSLSQEQASVYQVRKAARTHQLATAEVAAGALSMLGEGKNADILYSWFELFGYQYQCGVKRENQGNPKALENFLALTEKHSG